MAKDQINILVFVILVVLQRAIVHAHSSSSCTSSCGDVQNISYPFRVKGDPKHCGDKRYEIACDNKVPILTLFSGKYFVKDINYTNNTIRLVDAGLALDQPNNCSSIPLYFLSRRNFRDYYRDGYDTSYGNIGVAYLRCREEVVNDPLYVNVSCCGKCNSNISNIGDEGSAAYKYNYAIVGGLAAKNFKVGCHVKIVVLVDWENYYTSNYEVHKNVSYSDIHTRLLQGFTLSLEYCDMNNPTFNACGTWTTISSYVSEVFRDSLVLIGMLHVLKVVLGAPCVIILFCCKWRKRHHSMYEHIEEFLRSNNTLMPIRYSYKDIKNMTQGFKNKLGEGGFGAVFKGQLRSKQLVAVKMLISKSKCNNGQDFMSEVGTIGRIHHVNIVRLIGYCVEGTKRALVYEFMSNGSLDKYIFSKEDLSLSLDKIYEISIGVAQGIAYLHDGCDMRILHFDLKPHNILLDDNFKPKVSDFGLAKLYPVDESIVPLTAARGTIGYMAPELYYKNIGGVSYKADVYSFGMLLLEMAGRRRNLNAYAENSSQIYFPSWVYHQFIVGNEVEITDASDAEKKLVKKMIIVAFWCIQMKPTDRPSMKKVVEMLETEVECLPTPPKPFISLADLPAEDALIHTKSLVASLDSEKSELESDSLIMNAT